MDHFGTGSPTEATAAYDLHGPALSNSPLIVSVPHAGRDYSPELLELARVRPDMLRRLEDRWADMLASPLIARGYSVLIARAPRAMIDLNRHERELDPGMVIGLPRDLPLQSSAKLRGGLGLIPRRLPGAPELWQGPLPWDEVRQRIEAVHRPYHARLAQMMTAAREQHGHAILLDLHSMPPLPPPSAGQAAPGLVLGDRFGRSAAARLMSLADDVATGYGVLVSQNRPYAGDHLIERHGRPERDFHALQMEVDRALYLDVTLDRPGPGLARMQGVVTAIAEALANELPRSYAMAAE